MNDVNRFSGQLRHYHRSGAGPQRSWDEWADGEGGKPRIWKKWLKVAGILAAILALAGIAYALFNTLQ